MIKNLDFLESEIPEVLFTKAEGLLDQNLIVARKSQERNLLLFQCESHEIEVLVSPKYVKKYTCDCNHFKTGKFCAHIAGSLLLIRKNRQEKQARKKIEAKPKSTLSKITIDSIIEHIDHKILLAFMKQYARKNTKFDTALKVNFARRIPVNDVNAKYKNILDKILRPLTGVNESYTVPSINYFVKHGQELFEQYKDAISLQSYVEAATIITLLIKKCAYALLHAKISSDQLIDLNQALHDQVLHLLKSDIAPELREELQKKLLEIISLSYYSFPHIQNNIAYYLINQGEKDIHNSLQTVLIERLNSVVDKHVFSDLCTLILLNSSHSKKAYEEIFEDIKTHHLQRIFTHLLRLNIISETYTFIEACQEKEKLRNFSYKDILILLARKENRNDRLIPLLSEKFIHQKSNSILQELLSFDVKDTEEYLKKILRSISPHLAFAKNVIQVYVRLEDFDLMVDYILKHDLYSSMTEYINQVYNHSPTLVEFYIRKYKEKCGEDILYAHRNQIYVLRNIDEIEDAAFSNKFLNELRAFKEELEKIEVE